MKKKPQLSAKDNAPSQPNGGDGVTSSGSRRPRPRNPKPDDWCDMLEKFGDWIWTLDHQGRYTYSSRNVFGSLGYQPDQLLGRSALEWVVAEDAAHWQSLLSVDPNRHAPLVAFPVRYRHRCGEIITMEVNILPIQDEQQGLIGYRGRSMPRVAPGDEGITLRLPAWAADEKTVKSLLARLNHLISNPNTLIMMNARIMAEIWADVARILNKYVQQEPSVTLAGLPYTELREAVPKLIDDIYAGAQRIDRIVGGSPEALEPTRES